MISIAETLGTIAAKWHLRFTDEDRARCESILNAAVQVMAGTMPIADFGRLAGGQQRGLALLATPTSDPRRVPLLRAIDRLITYHGFVITTAGVWSPADLGQPSSLGPMRVHPAPQRDPWEEAA